MVKKEFNLSEKIELVEREGDVGKTEMILKKDETKKNTCIIYN